MIFHLGKCIPLSFLIFILYRGLLHFLPQMMASSIITFLSSLRFSDCCQFLFETAIRTIELPIVTVTSETRDTNKMKGSRGTPQLLGGRLLGDAPEARAGRELV